MPGILRVTNGTDSVDLLGNGKTGVYLVDWMPNVTQPNGGGDFLESIYQDGRRKIWQRWANVIDTFSVGVKGGDINDLAAALAILKRIFISNDMYWIAGSGKLAWIEKRGAKEANISYSVIYGWNLPKESNPFTAPSNGSGNSLTQLDIIIEHGAWLATAPNTSTGLSIYNDNHPTTTALDEIRLANAFHVTQITHAYTKTSGGVFSLNLIGSGMPKNLFPAGAATNYLYIGSTTGPFASLIYKVTQAGVYAAGATAFWSYWNGAAWTDLSTVGKSDTTAQHGLPFTVLGTQVHNFDPRSDWAKTTVNGTNAYWIELKITTAAVTTSPIQDAIDDIYTANKPYFDVTSAQLSGDLEVLLKLKLKSTQDCSSLVSLFFADRFIIGAKSLTTYPDFQGFLNIVGHHNGSNITADELTGAATEFLTTAFPAGAVRLLYAAPAAKDATNYIKITGSTAVSFYGKYHAYIRYHYASAAAANTVSIQLYVNNILAQLDPPSGVYHTDDVYLDSDEYHSYAVADMGLLEIPFPAGYNSDIYFIFWTTIHAAVTLDLYDLILIPIDEFAVDAYQPLQTDMYVSHVLTDYIQLDFTQARGPAAGIYSTGTPETYKGLMRIISSGPAALPPNDNQRVWMLAMDPLRDGGSSDIPLMLPRQASVANVTGISAYKLQRYIGMRGNL